MNQLPESVRRVTALVDTSGIEPRILAVFPPYLCGGRDTYWALECAREQFACKPNIVVKNMHRDRVQAAVCAA